LFIKNLFEREKFLLFSKKNKKFKKNQKNPLLVGFLGGFFGVFLGGFFWVGFLMPTLNDSGYCATNVLKYSFFVSLLLLAILPLSLQAAGGVSLVTQVSSH
jgi:hypothetical protein